MTACSLPALGVPWAVTKLETKVRLRATAMDRIVTSWHMGTNRVFKTPLIDTDMPKRISFPVMRYLGGHARPNAALPRSGPALIWLFPGPAAAPDRSPAKE